MVSPLVAPGEELSRFAPAAYAVGTREEVLAKVGQWIEEQERLLDGAGEEPAEQEEAV